MRALALAAALAVAGEGVAQDSGSVLPFTAAEVKRIAALGPWPPPRRNDPSNRVSGNADAIALGALLFHDSQLSSNGRIACVTCHVPGRAFTDGLPRAQGLARADRNTPGLANVGGQRWYGWDGAGDSLWAQSLRPILDAREMGGDLARTATRVREDPRFAALYAKAFGAPPGTDDEALAVDAAKALAAYQETFVSGRTPFDEFRDALVRGDQVAAARYPLAAQRGLALFVGKGRCTLCHGGPRLSNGEFHDVGVPFFVAPGRVDAGRYDGIRKLQGSRYNLLGAYNDDPARSTATSTRHVALEHRNYGEFRVPSLRGVARTAPYMHDGSLATLRDVVRHYSELDLNRLHADGEAILVPLRLAPEESAALVAFLESLDDEAGGHAQRPLPRHPRAPLLPRIDTPSTLQ